MNQGVVNGIEYSSKDYFKVFREKIVHEDNLINNRINWLIGFQGLLFTAYGILFKTISSRGGGENSSISFDALVDVVPIVGIVISVVALLSVLGAAISMGQTKSCWLRWGDGSPNSGAKSQCPELMTGWVPMVLGFTSTFGIPVLFICAWIKMT